MRAVGSKVRGEEGRQGARQIMLGLGGHDNDFGFHEKAIRIFKQRSDGVCHMFLEHHLGCWVENRVPIGSTGGSREKGAVCNNPEGKFGGSDRVVVEMMRNDEILDVL